MAGTVHLKTKNWERHPPIVPANPYLQGPASNYSLGLGGYIDFNGAWLSDAAGRGLYNIQPATAVREPLVAHIVTGTNGASVLNHRAEIIFTAPQTVASAQFFPNVRVDVNGKNSYGALIRTDIINLCAFFNDVCFSGLVAGNVAINLIPGTKYRVALDAVGANPATITARLYSWADPTTRLATLTGQNSDGRLQAASTTGFMTRAAAPFDGFVCEANYFTLGTDRTAGMPGILSYSADGTTITLWAREPDNFTGAASHQWQVSTTGLSSGFANVTAGTGGTTLKLANYPLSADTDYFFRIVQTDAAAPGSPVTSTVVASVRRKPTQKRMLISDSRGTQTTGGSESSLQLADWTSELWQAFFMERLSPDRFISFPANVSHGGAKTADFVNNTGQYYAATSAAVIANVPDEVDVQLGPNDGRNLVSSATYKANMANIIAWLLAAGVPKVWLHDPPFYYEAEAGVDLLASYSAALNELVEADVTGKLRRGATRDIFRVEAGLYPSGFDFAHLHVTGPQFFVEPLMRVKAVLAADIASLALLDAAITSGGTRIVCSFDAHGSPPLTGGIDGITVAIDGDFIGGLYGIITAPAQLTIFLPSVVNETSTGSISIQNSSLHNANGEYVADVTNFPLDNQSVIPAQGGESIVLTDQSVVLSGP